MATLLSAVNSTLMPAEVSAPIFSRTNELSAVLQLARRVPLAVNAQTAIPISMDVPAAGWVAEGAAKPASGVGMGVKTMTGKKVALIVGLSEELVRTNPAGVYDQLQQDLPTAIARSLDYAAIHGKDLRTNGAGPFTDYLKMTSNSVEIGTASAANGGAYVDLVNGEKLVVDKGYDFSGFAADPKLRPTLKLGVDTQGRPIWVDNPQAGIQGGTLIGYPAYYNRGVSGQYLRQGNRVQVVTETGTVTGGTYTLSGNGATTGTIAYNANAATVQTAVRTLGGPFAAATVAGASSPWTVTLGSVGVTGAPLTANGAALTGTNPGITVTTTTDSSSTTLRAIGGDWSQCAVGVGMDITLKQSREASYVDEAGNTVSAFQNNLILFLVEAYYGFVVGDPNAFVAYVDAA